MLKHGLAVMLLFVATLMGCTGVAQQTAQEEEPQMVVAKNSDFAVFSYVGRHYVTGSEKSTASFAEHGHLPYARTVLGAGPKGETVVFEINKKDPSYVERLVETYDKTPFIVDEDGDDYTVFKMGGRLYVTGNAKTKTSFAEHGHLPYTKTLLGAGPMGETVVFEVDKKDPAYTERLIKKFQS